MEARGSTAAVPRAQLERTTLGGEQRLTLRLARRGSRPALLTSDTQPLPVAAAVAVAVIAVPRLSAAIAVAAASAATLVALPSSSGSLPSPSTGSHHLYLYRKAPTAPAASPPAGSAGAASAVKAPTCDVAAHHRAMGRPISTASAVSLGLVPTDGPPRDAASAPRQQGPGSNVRTRYLSS